MQSFLINLLYMECAGEGGAYRIPKKPAAAGVKLYRQGEWLAWRPQAHRL